MFLMADLNTLGRLLDDRLDHLGSLLLGESGGLAGGAARDDSRSAASHTDEINSVAMAYFALRALSAFFDSHTRNHATADIHT